MRESRVLLEQETCVIIELHAHGVRRRGARLVLTQLAAGHPSVPVVEAGAVDREREATGIVGVGRLTAGKRIVTAVRIRLRKGGDLAEARRILRGRRRGAGISAGLIRALRVIHGGGLRALRLTGRRGAAREECGRENDDDLLHDDPFRPTDAITTSPAEGERRERARTVPYASVVPRRGSPVSTHFRALPSGVRRGVGNELVPVGNDSFSRSSWWLAEPRRARFGRVGYMG